MDANGKAILTYDDGKVVGHAQPARAGSKEKR